MTKLPKIIAANWKLNTSLADAYVLARGVLHGTEHMERIVTVLCPPAIWLTELAHEVVSVGMLPHLKLGAQNIFYEQSGPYTGEVSAKMVAEVAEYVIVGHSERVKFFHETAHDTALKLEAALAQNLQPILCVGELQATPEAAVQVGKRLEEVVENLSEAEKAQLIVAYEPVWAISNGQTGTPATPDYAESTMGRLKTLLPDGARVLYGGSANGENAASFLACPSCDGLLIGGASLKLKSFLQAAQAADDLAGAQGFRSLHN